MTKAIASFIHYLSIALTALAVGILLYEIDRMDWLAHSASTGNDVLVLLIALNSAALFTAAAAAASGKSRSRRTNIILISIPIITSITFALLHHFGYLCEIKKAGVCNPLTWAYATHYIQFILHIHSY